MSEKEVKRRNPNNKKQSRMDGRDYCLVPPTQSHPKAPPRPAPVTVKIIKPPESTPEKQE